MVRVRCCGDVEPYAALDPKIWYAFSVNLHTSEFFVGIGTLALLNAGLAQTKNRSGLGWFLGSFALGLIVALDKVPAK